MLDFAYHFAPQRATGRLKGECALFRALEIVERNRVSMVVGLNPSGVIIELKNQKSVEPFYDVITGYPKSLIDDLLGIERLLANNARVIGTLRFPAVRQYVLEPWSKTEGGGWIPGPPKTGTAEWMRFMWYHGETSPHPVSWEIFLRFTEAKKLAQLLKDYWSV